MMAVLLLILYLFPACADEGLSLVETTEEEWSWTAETYHIMDFTLTNNEAYDLENVKLQAEATDEQGKPVGKIQITAFGDDRITVRKRDSFHTTGKLTAGSSVHVKAQWEVPPEIHEVHSVTIRLVLSQDDGELYSCSFVHAKTEDGHSDVELLKQYLPCILMALGFVFWMAAIIRNRILSKK